MEDAMSFLTRRVPWATWQFGLLKTSMLVLGIILGAMFPEYWTPLLWPLGIVFLITAAWVTILWIRAMKMGA
jgi:hypothetical protein